MPGKRDKYQYLIGEEILHPDRSRIIEQGGFTYSPFEKVFEKQVKTIEEKRKKKVEALQSLNPSNQPKQNKLTVHLKP